MTNLSISEISNIPFMRQDPTTQHSQYQHDSTPYTQQQKRKERRQRVSRASDHASHSRDSPAPLQKESSTSRPSSPEQSHDTNFRNILRSASKILHISEKKPSRLRETLLQQHDLRNRQSNNVQDTDKDRDYHHCHSKDEQNSLPEISQLFIGDIPENSSKTPTALLRYKRSVAQKECCVSSKNENGTRTTGMWKRKYRRTSSGQQHDDQQKDTPGTGRLSSRSNDLPYHKQGQKDCYISSRIEDNERSTETGRKNYGRVCAAKSHGNQWLQSRRPQDRSSVSRPQSYAGPDMGTYCDNKDECFESSMSDLEGNKKIAKMNGLLDIWDAKDNPDWEKETFALCDLGHCEKCGKYYVPSMTEQHICRPPTRSGSRGS